MIGASGLNKKTTTIRTLFQDGKMKRSDLETFLKTGEEISQILVANLKQAAEIIRSFKIVAVDQCNEEPRTFRLKEYLDEILISLKPKLKKTRHTVTVNCTLDIELDSDPGALFQIINNLVVNSLVHGFETKKQRLYLINVHDLDTSDVNTLLLPDTRGSSTGAW